MMPLLVVHFAVTWALVGMIRTIQAVHYPLLKDVGHDGCIAYHERHMALITWVVGPLMLAEVSSAALLLSLGERSVFFGISLGALALIWGFTWVCLIALHQRLTQGYDAPTIQRLVRTNICRTACWTVRGFCLVVLLLSRLH